MTNRKVVALILVSAIAFCLLYIMASSQYYRIGYPLDDAWIHQTFARNLVQKGEWAINPGEPTAGSTSPLWTGLLALGYLFKINHFVWSFLLGIILLGSIGMLAILWIRRDQEVRWWKVLFGGLLVVSEWHLIWSAVSGMEILLFSTLVLTCLWLLSNREKNWLAIGVLCALSIWARPDGLTLLGPVFFALVVSSWKRQVKKIDYIRWIIPLLVSLAAYLWWNFHLSGSIWPNTFAAKQAEYSILQQTSIIVRYMNAIVVPMTGVGFLLLPGLFLWIIRIWRDRAWVELGMLLWLLGYVFIYAWKLPVTYQHGRYIMPVIPVYLCVSLRELIRLDVPGIFSRWKYIVARVYLLLLAVIPLSFLVLGMRAYQNDVAIIESEMVQSARWIAENTAPEGVIAAHDIGALGYYGNRRILDLAGLINPEVIPIITNTSALSAYIHEKKVDYLVIFPGWYHPSLQIDGLQIFQTTEKYSTDSGGANMEIWKIKN